MCDWSKQAPRQKSFTVALTEYFSVVELLFDNNKSFLKQDYNDVTKD